MNPDRDYEREDLVQALFTLMRIQRWSYDKAMLELRAYDEHKEALELAQETLDVNVFGHPNRRPDPLIEVSAQQEPADS